MTAETEHMFRLLGRAHYFKTVFEAAPVAFDGGDYEPGFDDWVTASIDVGQVFQDFSKPGFINEFEPELEKKYNKLCDAALQLHASREVE